MDKKFDVVVIGGGPGGYIAAIRSAQLGFNTACIDKFSNIKNEPALGGTCTNVGCIPSKALLQSSEHYEHAGNMFSDHGIEIKNLNLNLKQMMKRKDSVVQQNNEGVLYLFRKNKVNFFHGQGSLVKECNGFYKIKVTGTSEETLLAKHIIIATGSTARSLPELPFDEKIVLSNTGALAIDTIPSKVGVIGAGVIGLEMGSVWRRLGADVSILEISPIFLETVDEQISKEAKKLFAKQGLKITLGIKIVSVTKNKDSVTIEYVDNTGKTQEVTYEKLIVSIGRVPNTLGLNHEEVGLQIDERGFIVVDADCRTNLPNTWAIGDVVRGPMLAHKAEEEGVAVAERIAGQHSSVKFNTMPWVIYTSPEISWVGKTEQQLKASNTPYKAGTFPFSANGRARAAGETSGMVKLLADAETDEILGVHIIGPKASELISEAVLAMEFRASAEDIARVCHAHPSLSESMKEAALSVEKRSLNF
jgi:dihydrolipoamide dehydrogenase